MNQIRDGSGSSSRCGSCSVCLVLPTTVSIVVLMVAILTSFGLASRGGGYSIGAAAIVASFLLFIILFPAIGGVIFCVRTGLTELTSMLMIILFCLAVVFTLSPLIFVLAFALTIAGVVVGEGDSAVRALAVFAAVIELLAAVAGLFLCVMCCVYIRRHSLYQVTKEEKQLAEDMAAKKKVLMKRSGRGSDVI